jgi:hypothetical protein
MMLSASAVCVVCVVETGVTAIFRRTRTEKIPGRRYCPELSSFARLAHDGIAGEKITLDREAQRFIDEMDAKGELRIIANQPRRCDDTEYTHREQEQREDNNIPWDEPIIFLEIYVRDASEFSADLNIHGVRVGRHRVLRGESAAVANAIAAFLLYLREDKGKVPHAYFNWTEGNPLLYLLHYVLSGEGDVAPRDP